MKREKLGDVYAFKTDRGYRIMQWAYNIEKRGKYIKVFDGFFDQAPDNLDEIVRGDCLYMLPFPIQKLYKKGIVELWGNFQAPEQSTFSGKHINFVQRIPGLNIIIFEIGDMFTNKSIYFCGDMTGNAVPEQYRNLSCLNSWNLDGFPKEFKQLRALNLWAGAFLFMSILESDFSVKNFAPFWETRGAEDKYKARYYDILASQKRKADTDK